MEIMCQYLISKMMNYKNKLFIYINIHNYLKCKKFFKDNI